MSNKSPTKEPDADALAQVTARIFEYRMKKDFAEKMAIEFDTVTEKRLAHHGYAHAKVFNAGYEKARGRLAVFFDAVNHKHTAEFLFEMEGIAREFAIRRALVPGTRWNRTSYRDAANFKELCLLPLGSDVPTTKWLFSEYYYDPEIPSGVLVKANFYVERIISKMSKIFHIMLSDFAAPNYNESYGKGAFGTKSAMDSEEKLIGAHVAKFKGKGRAVELGCGTGRHTLYILARKFREVVGYDFSGEMIDIARRTQQEYINGTKTEPSKPKYVDGISFGVRDVEDDPLCVADGRFDFVLGAFGMGSFVEDIDRLLSSIAVQLQPAGMAILSFYNKEALRYVAPPPWRDSALAAELVHNRDELNVNLSSGEKFQIYCKAYHVQDLREILSSYFGDVKLNTSSALASFLPEQYFSTGNAVSAKDIIRKFDEELELSGLENGAYLTAVCRSPHAISPRRHRLNPGVVRSNRPNTKSRKKGTNRKKK